jgi:hypothetical protein
MAKRLLNDGQALEKIALSLKLQGADFSPNYLNCNHCKFCWGNIPGGRPKRPAWPVSASPLTPPDKLYWVCFKYKNSPTHSYLRYNIHRTEASGKIRILRWWRQWNPLTQKNEYYIPAGCKDEIVFVKSGEKFRAHICRRYEPIPGR